MANIYSLPTVLVEPLPIDSETKVESRGSRPKPRSCLSGCTKYIWDFLCYIYAYWTFLAHVPPDLLFHNGSATPGSGLKDGGSAVGKHSEAGDKHARLMGQLALHPTLPLLAALIRGSVEIHLYQTLNSQEICKYEVTDPNSEPHDQSRGAAVITCLQFSSGNVLAVGLSDGTVRIVHQNLGAIVRVTPNSSGTYHRPDNVQVVNFLPGHSSDVSARFLGPVTNLVFSPTSRGGIGLNAWLAVATEKSGVWVWNHRTNQTLRAFRTRGVREGSLHWARLTTGRDTKPTPSSSPSKTPPAKEKFLSRSAIQQFENVFGNAQDLRKLDEYFALASKKEDLPLPRRPPLEDIADAGDLDGHTVLVVGTKSGQVRVYHVWQSSTMIQMETFVDFPFRKSAKSRPEFPSNSHTAGVEISHLVVHRVSVVRETVIVPILIALGCETSLILHQVVVRLPFKRRAPPIPLSHLAYDDAKTALRHFVNLIFFITQTDHQWPPDISTDPTDDDVPAVSYRGAGSVRLSSSSSTSQASLVSLILQTPTPVLLVLYWQRCVRPCSSPPAIPNAALAAFFFPPATLKSLLSR